MDNIELIGKGRMAEVYTWGEDKILKLNLPNFPLVVARQEFIASQAAQAARIPVPKVYEMIELDGRHGIVFERISGSTLLDDLQAKPWKLFSTARLLAELHAQIHSVEGTGEMPMQKERVENGIEAAQGVSDEEKQIVRQYMSALPDGSTLCHGDFHPGNILLSSKGPVIIDWLTGSKGDPLSDVCRTMMIFETVILPPDTPWMFRQLQKYSRSLLVSIYLKRYQQLRHVKIEEITRWRLPLLMARIREVEGFPLEKELILTQMRGLIAVLNKEQNLESFLQP